MHAFIRERKRSETQSGINVVDLMMWLVIAVLLLAAVIQGIGYYQKAAILYAMKNDADGAGTNTMMQATSKGDIDFDTLNEGLSQSNWSKGNLYAAQEPLVNSRMPYLRVTHPQITDKDVIYLFEACSDKYNIGVNVIPKNGSILLENCGISSNGNGTGGGGGSTTPAMVTVWDNTLPECPSTTAITLPIDGGTHNVTVDWGDGTTTTVTDASGSDARRHVYSTTGKRTITISGTFSQWGNYSMKASSLPCLTDITRWDDTGTTDISYGFYKATSLNSISNIPAGITRMNSTFRYATNFNGNISNWDTSKVTDMAMMFLDANRFNQNIGSWETSNVVNMNQMFTNAYDFDQPIGNWKIHNVTDISQMFQDARSFNQNISTWDTGKVTTLAYTFSGASKFDSPLPWNTANVTSFQKTLANAAAFSQPVVPWNTAKATTMQSMFEGTTKFDGDLSSFDTSNVTSMSSMFSKAAVFNHSLAHFKTQNVTDMTTMFAQAYEFNQNLSTWDTSKVQQMTAMFNQAYKFNQNLSMWNVTAVGANHNTFIKVGYPTAYLPVWVA